MQCHDRPHSLVFDSARLAINIRAASWRWIQTPRFQPQPCSEKETTLPLARSPHLNALIPHVTVHT
jgi:hypothetical protein